MSVDETTVDEMSLDKMSVDEMTWSQFNRLLKQQRIWISPETFAGQPFFPQNYPGQPFSALTKTSQGTLITGMKLKRTLLYTFLSFKVTKMFFFH